MLICAAWSKPSLICIGQKYFQGIKWLHLRICPRFKLFDPDESRHTVAVFRSKGKNAGTRFQYKPPFASQLDTIY